MTIFIWCALIGVGLMILTMVFDGLIDFDDNGWIFAITTSVMAFGGLGSIFSSANFPFWVCLTLSTIFAFLAGTLVIFLVRKLKDDNETNDFTENLDAIGEVGEVVWWGCELGEVDVLLDGDYKRLPATSKGILKNGSKVTIVGVDKSGLQVEKF